MMEASLMEAFIRDCNDEFILMEAPPVRAVGSLMEAVSEFLSSLYSYGILDIIVDYDHNSIEAVEFASIALPWKQNQRLRSRLSCPPP